MHAGEPAPTAERLMRARYSAFALGAAEYLLHSWDPATRPRSMDLDDSIVWKRLFIERAEAGGPFDAEGFVTFTAVGSTPDGRFEQRERSRFTRDDDGRWVYTDGAEP
ncbi:YchJ family protein [Leucobacter triazinivorans]